MSGRFDVKDTPIQGLKLLQRKPVGDARGFLERMFCSQELQAFVAGKAIVQINRTVTVRLGSVRGLHFQHPPHAEIKFVSCLRGEVFDVAVDLRRGSATFLQWHAEILSPEKRNTFLIPEGFAHGFQALAENCELLYFHTAAYKADAEGGLNSGDPRLRIAWPLPVADLSARDAAHPLVTADFQGIAA